MIESVFYTILCVVVSVAALAMAFLLLAIAIDIIRNK